MRDEHPNTFQAIDKSNDAAHTAFLNNIIGTPEMIEAAENARDAATSQAREAAFANETPVDHTPIVQQINDAMNENRGNKEVLAALGSAQEKLLDGVDHHYDEQGELVNSDIKPSVLYNVRKSIGYSLSSKARGTTADASAAAAQLHPLMPTIDNVIEQGAPGFKDYMQQYSALSKPIDAMDFLQGQKLLDPAGSVKRGAVDNLLNQIKVQQNAPGFRPADSVTPEQVKALTDLRSSMNLANQRYAGKSGGSNTYQNLVVGGKTNALLSGAGGHVANMAASGIGGVELGGPVGFATTFAGNALRNAYAARTAATIDASKQALLQKLIKPNALTAAGR